MMEDLTQMFMIQVKLMKEDGMIFVMYIAQNVKMRVVVMEVEDMVGLLVQEHG